MRISKALTERSELWSIYWLIANLKSCCEFAIFFLYCSIVSYLIGLQCSPDSKSCTQWSDMNEQRKRRSKRSDRPCLQSGSTTSDSWIFSSCWGPGIANGAGLAPANCSWQLWLWNWKRNGLCWLWFALDESWNSSTRLTFGVKMADFCMTAQIALISGLIFCVQYRQFRLHASIESGTQF